MSKLYPGVTHHRTVVILRQGLVLVHDELASAGSHEYSQTWHLAPNATPAGTAATLTATASGKPQLTITQADPEAISLQSFDGATGPMQGWYSSSYGSRRPSWALQYTRDGTTAGLRNPARRRPLRRPRARRSPNTPKRRPTRSKPASAAATGYVVSIPHDNAVAPTIASGGCPG